MEPIESMARHFEIRELKNSIQISVAEDLPLGARILAGFIAAAAALSLSWALLGNWSWIAAFCIAGVALAAARGSRADLDVTNVEFVTRGNIGRRGSKATQVVCTGNVRGLEFRDTTGQQSGIYALTARSSQCILPFVGHSEAMDVIRAIQMKFPGSAETWRVEAGSSEHFLTLGLEKGK
jgi:hypothetical protein